MDEEQTSQIEDRFAELRTRLKDYKGKSAPTDENLHFARFEDLDDTSLVELTELARDGLAKVQENDDFFSQRDLYADGMFWYELCLAISSTAVSYQSSTGRRPRANEVAELVALLVDVSHYAARRPSDMYKRNREALGNMLWAAQDEALINRARQRAGEIAETHVIAFVEDTIGAVREATTSTQNPKTPEER